MQRGAWADAPCCVKLALTGDAPIGMISREAGDASKELFGFSQRTGLADVEKAKAGLYVAIDRFFVTDFQIEVDDAEALGEVIEVGKEPRRHVVNAGKGVLAVVLRIDVGIGTAYFASRDVSPSHKAHLVVEEEVSLRLALADKQGGSTIRVES